MQNKVRIRSNFLLEKKYFRSLWLRKKVNKNTNILKWLIEKEGGGMWKKIKLWIRETTKYNIVSGLGLLLLKMDAQLKSENDGKTFAERQLSKNEAKNWILQIYIKTDRMPRMRSLFRLYDKKLYAVSCSLMTK